MAREATSSSTTLFPSRILKPGRISSKPNTEPYTNPNTVDATPQQAMIFPSHIFLNRAKARPMTNSPIPCPTSPNMMPKNRQ